MRAFLAGLCFLLAASLVPARAGENGIAVVASLKPVHSIAASVMQGAGAPELLLAGAASPHSYALKPSDAKKIAEAKLIFWIGPELETFLVAPLARVDAGTRVIALGDAMGVLRLSAREGGLWEDGEHDHEHGDLDPHLWLDPRNGAAMARAMAEALAAEDPMHAELYRGNANRFAARMEVLDAELARMLAPVKGRPYIVLHDAYHYFEDRYGLTPAGAVTVAADRPVGVRRVLEIRARLKETRIPCVFAPPQFSPKLMTALSEGVALRTGSLDDLGATLPAGPQLYENLLRRMAADAALCLAP